MSGQSPRAGNKASCENSPLTLSGPGRPSVGAIRWDAWHGERGTPGRAVEKALGPAKWRYRLPFFATVRSDLEVAIDGATQQVMDQEIAYAAAAGLDYWAFVTYAPNDAMSLSLKLYLASKRKREIRFCLITEHGQWGNRSTYRERISRFASLMREETYHKVLDGRPLLYLGFIRDEAVTRDWGSIEEFRKAVDDLRADAGRHDAANPYIVVMDFDPRRATTLREKLGADAIGSYAAQGGESGAPYASLAAYAQRFWGRSKDSGSAVVPIVMSGWDRRPRVDNPVPWEKWQQPGVGIEKYYESPLPSELAGHLKRALLWIRNNREAAPADTALIYAWNENDEGGWLVPTLCEKNDRLDEIRRVLKP